MAYQYTSNGNGDMMDHSSNNDRHNRRSNDPSSAVMAPPVSQRRAVSRPIPIPQRNKQQQFASTQYSSDTEKLAHSLPAHLRAPMLSSTPRGLPDVSLPLLGDSATVTAASTPYGSLRESQQFLSVAAASAPTRSGIVVAPTTKRGGRSGLAELLSSREQRHDEIHNSSSQYLADSMSDDDDDADESIVVASSLTTGLDILRRTGGGAGHPVVPRSYSEPTSMMIPPPAAFLLPPAANAMESYLERASLQFHHQQEMETSDEPFELDL